MKSRPHLKIVKILRNMRHTLATHPVESLMLLYFFVTRSYISTINPEPATALWAKANWYVHILVLIALSISRYRSKNLWIKVAYWSVPMLWAALSLLTHPDIDNITFASAYITLAALTPLAYLLSAWPTNDRAFSRQAAHMGISTAIALFISIVLFAVLMAIIFTIDTLFLLHHHTFYYITIFIFIFATLFPLLFIGLEDSEITIKDRTLPHIVVSYIMVPALILYTLVIYVYGATILIRWELPEGNVAVMIGSFMIVSLIVTMLRNLLPHPNCKWYFRHFGYIVLPMLLLFWIGSLYRINQYGLTIGRCYLLATGTLSTIYALLHIIGTQHKYIILSFVAASIFITMGINSPLSAHRLSVKSQYRQYIAHATQLHLLDPEGNFQIPDNTAVNDTLTHQLESIYSNLQYIHQHDTIFYNQHHLLDIDIVDEATYHLYNTDQDTYKVFLETTNEQIPLQGHTTLIKDIYAYDRSRITLFERQYKIKNIIDHQLQTLGYGPDNPPTAQQLKAHSKEMLHYEDSYLTIYFRELNISFNPDGTYHCNQYYIDAALLKEQKK